jgi:hypothetical protein
MKKLTADEELMDSMYEEDDSKWVGYGTEEAGE